MLFDGKCYHYKAFVKSVYDGDTITVDIDLGFGIIFKDQKLRLYGINAPEVRGEERHAGLLSRDWLREKIDQKDILVKTIKDKKGKYGRWLALVFIDNTAISVNREMVTLNFAREAMY